MKLQLGVVDARRLVSAHTMSHIAECDMPFVGNDCRAAHLDAGQMMNVVSIL